MQYYNINNMIIYSVYYSYKKMIDVFNQNDQILKSQK